ncbi:MAG: ribonuclease E/G [Lachnospiraceae bacterium]|nr:ribonuclease E/G [Lachnospiraceae bacterium]
MSTDRVVITEYEGVILTALIRDGHVFDLMGRAYTGDKKCFIPGDIVRAKVSEIQKNINAAFLKMGDGVKAFMDLEGYEDLKCEDEITVQVIKEPIREKEMLVTPDYSVAGKYLAFSKGKSGIGISRRIDGDDRKRLKKTVKGLMGDDTCNGVVIRTNALEASDEEIAEEFRSLKGTMDMIEEKSSYTVPFKKLYSETPPEIRYLRDMKDKPERVITDIPEVFNGLQDFYGGSGDDTDLLKLYTDDNLPLRKLYPVEAALNEVRCRVIHLHGGGNLVIDITEALTVIDVNSGKSGGRSLKKETVLKTNLEAVREAARQIRIRNLSGMILIDLINMESGEDRKTVIDELKAELLKDRVRSTFVDLTKLGIAELTRERIDVPLVSLLPMGAKRASGTF